MLEFIIAFLTFLAIAAGGMMAIILWFRPPEHHKWLKDLAFTIMSVGLVVAHLFSSTLLVVVFALTAVIGVINLALRAIRTIRQEPASQA